MITNIKHHMLRDFFISRLSTPNGADWNRSDPIWSKPAIITQIIIISGYEITTCTLLLILQLILFIYLFIVVVVVVLLERQS